MSAARQLGESIVNRRRMEGQLATLSWSTQTVIIGVELAVAGVFAQMRRPSARRSSGGLR